MVEPAHSAVVAASAGPLVTLFDTAGRPLQVPSTDVDHWLVQGLQRDPADIDALIAQARLLCDDVARLYVAFVESVQRDGHIDTSASADLAAAQAALALLLDTVGALERAIAARYPVRQRTPARMRASTAARDAEPGAEANVDPSQVEHYSALGWEVIA